MNTCMCVTMQDLGGSVGMLLQKIFYNWITSVTIFDPNDSRICSLTCSKSCTLFCTDGRFLRGSVILQ